MLVSEKALPAEKAFLDLTEFDCDGYFIEILKIVLRVQVYLFRDHQSKSLCLLHLDFFRLSKLAHRYRMMLRFRSAEPSPRYCSETPWVY